MTANPITEKGFSTTSYAAIRRITISAAITCTFPTKTFNLSGLPCANIFIEDFNIREKIRYELFNSYYPKPGAFDLTAAKRGSLN
jgi:cystathionine beta-lyase